MAALQAGATLAATRYQEERPDCSINTPEIRPLSPARAAVERKRIDDLTGNTHSGGVACSLGSPPSGRHSSFVSRLKIERHPGWSAVPGTPGDRQRAVRDFRVGTDGHHQRSQ